RRRRQPRRRVSDVSEQRIWISCHGQRTRVASLAEGWIQIEDRLLPSIARCGGGEEVGPATSCPSFPVACHCCSSRGGRDHGANRIGRASSLAVGEHYFGALVGESH